MVPILGPKMDQILVHGIVPRIRFFNTHGPIIYGHKPNLEAAAYIRSLAAPEEPEVRAHL